MSTTPDGRWPRSVFGVGSEPDPRFTFANERTFLAWIRTSLGLTASGVAVHALAEHLAAGARMSIALMLVALGIATAGFGFVRWAFNERALRRGGPLPGFVMGAVISTGLLLGGVVVLLEVIAT